MTLRVDGLTRIPAIAGVDLLRRFRNRSMVVTAFVAPLLLAVILGWILDGVSSRTYTIGIVDAARTPASGAIVGSLLDLSADPAIAESFGVAPGAAVAFRVVDAEEDATRQVTDDELSAAVVIPAGFDPDHPSTSPSLRVVQSPRRAVSGQVALGVADAVSERVLRANVAVLTADRRSVEDPAAVVAAAVSAPSSLPVRVEPAGGGVSPIAYFGASMCIVFLFFTVGYASRSVMIDREDGMLDRLLSTPTSLTSVILGKALSVAAMGTVGFIGVWAATSLVFGARWGGIGPVLLLILATVTSIAGISMFVSSFGKTERQADAYATIVTFVLALLGGNFIPVGSAPEAFRRLAVLTPNGWALRGFSEVSSGATAAAVASSAAVLVVIGVAGGAIGFVRLHRSVAP
jgi:ABC-2 type transport system permease protein